MTVSGWADPNVPPPTTLSNPLQPLMPTTVYDIFHPGAAFYQTFALVHVTNDRIEVTYADNTDGNAANDFNNTSKTVSFVTANDYVKDLASPPVALSESPGPPSIQGATAIVTSSGSSYLVTMGNGFYTVDALSENGVSTETDAGPLPTPLFSPLLSASPSGRFFAVQGTTVDAFTLSNGKLTKQFTGSVPPSDGIMAFELNQTDYLLTYASNTEIATIFAFACGGLGPPMQLSLGVAGPDQFIPYDYTADGLSFLPINQRLDTRLSSLSVLAQRFNY